MNPIRRLVPLLTAVLAVGSVAACSSPGASAPEDPLGNGRLEATVPELEPDQQVEIVFESYNLLQAGVWTDTVTDLVDEFEAEHPNITVTAQPTQSTGTAGISPAGSVQTQLLAGNPPDVAQITFDSIDYVVNQVGAKPLEQLVGSDAVEEHLQGEHPFHERVATLGDWNGVTYGVPYVLSTPVLFYNASALEAAGIPADVDLSTWEAVQEVAETVTAATGRPSLSVACAVSGGAWCLQGMIRSNGGRVLSEDRSTLEFGEPEAVGAVEMLRGLYDAGVLANEDREAQYESFARGDTVMQLQTSALQGTYTAAAQAGGWDLRSAPMPAFGDKPVMPTNSGSALFVFSEDPAKQRAAWEFVRFMTSDRAYEEISSRIGYLPLRTSLTEPGEPLHEWATGNPLVAPNLAQLEDLQPWVSYPGNNYVQVDDVLAAAVEDAVFYGADPAEALQAAQDRAQDLIDD